MTKMEMMKKHIETLLTMEVFEYCLNAEELPKEFDKALLEVAELLDEAVMSLEDVHEYLEEDEDGYEARYCEVTYPGVTLEQVQNTLETAVKMMPEDLQLLGRVAIAATEVRIIDGEILYVNPPFCGQIANFLWQTREIPKNPQVQVKEFKEE